jgi:hypothetical protein
LAIAFEFVLLMAGLTVLAPVGPVVFFSKRFEFARALRLGAQRFAGLLFTNFLAMLIALVVLLVCLFVAGLSALAQYQLQGRGPYVALDQRGQLIQSIVILIAFLFAMTAALVIFTAPAARIVRELTVRADDVADTFD